MASHTPLIKDLNQKQSEALSELIDKIADSKILNEIDKMIFSSKQCFARFLIASNYKPDLAFQNFKTHL